MDLMGFRNSLTHIMQSKTWRMNNIFMLSNINSLTDQGYFLRPTINITRMFPKWKNYSLSGMYSLEHNEIVKKATDSMAPQSFSFQTIQVLKSDESKPNKWGITYFTRTDAYPLGKDLVKADRSQNVNLTTELMKNESHQFRLSATYRRLGYIKQDYYWLESR